MGELIDQMYLMQQVSSQCFFSENWLQMDLMPRRYNAPTANVVAAVQTCCTNMLFLDVTTMPLAISA